MPQLNLYYTDLVSESENENVLQHDCLRVTAYFQGTSYDRQMIFYCMSELSSKFPIENNDIHSQFTFAELLKQNITSQQLYLWSTPIDIIEHYQFYLNQLLTSSNSSLANKIFYNCTIPRFGPMCQYELPYEYPSDLSLPEIIFHFQNRYRYLPTTFTCYTHLKCNRGPFPACLDWSEICNGRIDCINDGFDEEHCWQLEINECNDNEYRCVNGQCIPKSFYRDNYFIADCIDASDKSELFYSTEPHCHKYEQPCFGCDDVTCKHTYFTSSCTKDRENLLIKAMYLSRDGSASEDCWSALKYLLNFTDLEYSSGDKFCQQNTCKKIINNTCPNILYFSSIPGLIGDIYFAYTKNDLLSLTTIFPSMSFYICYNKSYSNNDFVNASKMFFNNMTCIHSEHFYPQLNMSFAVLKYRYYQNIYMLFKNLKRYHLIYNYTSAICNKPNMYQCMNSSKCISVYRLIDTIYDCPQMDDENINVINNTNLMEQFKNYRFKCELSNKYIHPTLHENGLCDCGKIEFDYCEDEDIPDDYLRGNVSFQNICDGFIDILPITIEGQTETDETECEQWQCNNIYTHCNDVWNCPNGADEGGCVSSSTLNCSSNHHLCVSPDTNQLMCLPIKQANDSHIDCLGATDEPTLCKRSIQTHHYYDFYCLNQNSKLCVQHIYLCDGNRHCEYGDDEQFCTSNRTSGSGYFVCSNGNDRERSDVEKFICSRLITQIRRKKYFAFDGMSEASEKLVLTIPPIVKLFGQDQPHCYRGLHLRVWLTNKNNLPVETCLCPPTFYGDRCQYQNQRISLALKFRASSDSWQTLFAIVILLIDDSDKRIIHSYEQFTYLSTRDCKIKFNVYLFYSTRPKNLTKHYAIHIDIYEKVSLNYRASLLLPIAFPFLPVHRLAFIVDIPRNDDDNLKTCSTDQCVHGKCIHYSNKLQDMNFCQCHRGWSGQYCTIPHICICSSDSICIGISTNNRSICVCPIHKFGSRCLIDTVCPINDNSTCQNGGQCIPNDDYMISTPKFVCNCPKGFSRDRCEIIDTKLILSFSKDIVLSQSIFIHFIKIIDIYNEPIRSTIFRTIPVRQDSMTIHWSQSFHLVFIELLNKNYYLTVVQKIYNRSAIIFKMINSLDRCRNINELFNETFVQWHHLRRIKYYHLPCQIYSPNLSCFYDDIYLCLCYNFKQQRLANCLSFDHNMTFNCLGQSECENDGQCFQDTPDCSKRSICVCPQCFYGILCQFSTNGFGLSLDAILGYHILPEIRLIHQPLIIQMSAALTIIFIVIGFINGILSMITFKNKSICEAGCGLYLLGSSITTLLTIFMFGLKFWILICAQMTIISNRSFLSFQCHSIDFFLRVCLCMDQWLNACVAVERAITAIKGVHFNKKKSKQTAKFVIIIILIVIVTTSIHDPIYRRLIDEINDDDNIKRIWCIVSYRPDLQIYNSVMQIFHFSIPFMMNLISAIILIRKQSRQQATIHLTENIYKNNFDNINIY